MNKIDNSGAGIAALGRNGDEFMAHVAAGEMVVPPVITPETRARLFQEMQQAGLDPDRYTVGEGMSINPITGLPEFFFKKVFKGVKKIVKKVAPVVLPMVLPGVGNVLGGALSSAGTALGIPSGIGSSLLGGKGILDTFAGARGGITSLLGGKGGGGTQQGLGSIFPGGLFGEDSFADKVLNIDPNKGTGPFSFLNQFAPSGTPSGTPSGGLGGGLGTLANLAILKKILDQPKGLDPAQVVPMGAAAFGYTPAMTEALKNDSYRIGNLKPALIQGQQYANIDPDKMATGTPITTAEAGGIMGLQEGGMMINPNRMDDNGPGDITPAFLEPGEFVMTRPATQVLGARNLYSLMKAAEGMA